MSVIILMSLIFVYLCGTKASTFHVDFLVGKFGFLSKNLSFYFPDPFFIRAAELLGQMDIDGRKVEKKKYGLFSL
jgi:hypothetical protein